MGTKVKIGSASNLYEYWRDGIADYINAELAELPEQERFVINCASQVPCSRTACASAFVSTVEATSPSRPGTLTAHRTALRTGILQGGGHEASECASHQRRLSG
jgi:hypothetical protein